MTGSRQKCNGNKFYKSFFFNDICYFYIFNFPTNERLADDVAFTLTSRSDSLFHSVGLGFSPHFHLRHVD